MNTYRWFCFLLIFAFEQETGSAQNLVPNPSFEDINDTIRRFVHEPSEFDSRVKDWTTVNTATPDLITPDFYAKIVTSSKAQSGLNTVGIRSALHDDWGIDRNFWGEYVGTKLKDDLIPKRTYHVEYWIRKVKFKSPKVEKSEKMNSNFGIHFYSDALKISEARMIHAEPQVKADSSIVVTDSAWVKISVYFTPESKCNKICLGQFCQIDVNPIIMEGYYQIDDVLVEELRDFSTFDKKVKLTTGTIIPLNEVQFETGTTKLSNEKSNKQLTELVTYLNMNPKIKVRVNGHTDFVGKKEANITLSNNRAEFIATYIIQQGINKERIDWKGFGDESPIDNNKTKQGRARNRRVEFEVI